MERKELIKNIVESLKRMVNGRLCHRSRQAYRAAGGLETLLIELGVLNPNDKFDYQTGGKKYFPLIGDFRWTEAYPHFMLRKAQEYLEQFIPAEQEALLIKLAFRNGWVLTGHKGEECYWRNPTTNTDKQILGDRPLIEQMPFEIKIT